MKVALKKLIDYYYGHNNSMNINIRILISLSLFICLSLYKLCFKSESKITVLFFPILAYFIILNTKCYKIIKFFLLFLLYFLEIIEDISFYTTGFTFNDQFLYNAIDIPSAVKDLPETFRLIVIAFILLIIFTVYNCTYKYIVDRYMFLIILFFSFFLYKKVIHIYFTLFPFVPNPFQVKDVGFINKLNKYYNLNPSIRGAPSIKKNLFILILESFELNDLGPYNQKLPNLMPFLSKLATSTTIFDNILMPQFVRESIASTLCAFCNFPYIRRRAKFHRNPKFKCFPKFLEKINYSNYMLGSYRLLSDNILDFFRRRSFHMLDGTVHHKYTDHEAADWLISNFLPKLKYSQPFLFVFYTVNTHWGKYVHQCPKKFRKYNDDALDEFECVDIWVKKLYNALKEQEYFNQTEIIIYGDHNRGYTPTYRSEAIILPQHKWGNISKLINYYDFVHLVFHLLNISDTSPEFIFGSDPLSPDYNWKPPNSDELQYIYKSSISSFFI